MTSAAIVVLLAGFVAHGQGGARPEALLAGVSSVRVAVDDLSQYATACGVTKEAIKAIVSKHLIDGQVRVEEDATVVFLVKVHTLYIGEPGICVSQLADTLRAEGPVLLPYADATRRATVILSDTGGALFASKSADHATRLATILEIAARRTAGEIIDANR